MKYRLTLQEPQLVTNTFGEKEQIFVTRRTVWAERVKLTGRRSEEVAEHFADYTTQYRIRDAHPIAEGWHVRQLGRDGHTYIVCAIEPNRDRGMLTLFCERLNE